MTAPVVMNPPYKTMQKPIFNLFSLYCKQSDWMAIDKDSKDRPILVQVEHMTPNVDPTKD